MDSVLVSRKALLEELLNSAGSVMTSNYIFSLNLIDCKTGDQYDAYECLLQWLSKMYQVVTDTCMFKIVNLESAVYKNLVCDQRVDKTTDEHQIPEVVLM